MLSDWMNNSWDTVTWQSCFVVIGFPLFWIQFPLLTHLRDSNVVQFQQSLFTAKVSYHTVIGYSATTIFDRVTEACNNEKRIKKTETAKQSTFTDKCMSIKILSMYYNTDCILYILTLFHNLGSFSGLFAIFSRKLAMMLHVHLSFLFAKLSQIGPSTLINQHCMYSPTYIYVTSNLQTWEAPPFPWLFCIVQNISIYKWYPQK